MVAEWINGTTAQLLFGRDSCGLVHTWWPLSVVSLTDAFVGHMSLDCALYIWDQCFLIGTLSSRASTHPYTLSFSLFLFRYMYLSLHFFIAISW